MINFGLTKTLLATALATFLSAGLVGCANNKDGAPSSNTTTENTATTTTNQDLAANLQNNLIASGIDANIIATKATKVDGIYWVNAQGMPPFFTDATGQHIIQGPIIAVGTDKPTDIGADMIAEVAKQKLAAINTDEMIIYPAKGETKGTIYAFTDPTCPYCQKLHEELGDINAKGIEVRYLAWPRNQTAEPIMQSIWCSDDKKTAFAAAITENGAQSPKCETPIQQHTEIGFSLGVQGTPALFTESGEQIGGYLPPEQIANALGL